MLRNIRRKEREKCQFVTITQAKALKIVKKKFEKYHVPDSAVITCQIGLRQPIRIIDEVVP